MFSFGRLCKLQNGCTRLAAASDKFYQLLAHGRWYSAASSTTKTGRHDIAESGVKHNKSNQIKSFLIGIESYSVRRVKLVKNAKVTTNFGIFHRILFCFSG